MTSSGSLFRSGSWALGAAAVAAVLASSCCVLPLLLVSIGFSAGWLANLRILQPYSTILTVVAVAALLLSAVRMFRQPAACNVPVDGTGSAERYYKPLFWLVAALTLAVLIVPLVAPWFY
jgi:mercuric ion transport protein